MNASDLTSAGGAALREWAGMLGFDRCGGENSQRTRSGVVTLVGVTA